MNVQEHYESYKMALQKDLLPGSVEFSKKLPTLKPEIYPTVFDFLKKASDEIKKAIEASDEKVYRHWLKQHQSVMLGLMQRYVESLQMNALDLIEKKGHRFYRFSKENVILQGDYPMVWIPRYPTTIRDVTFDAEELELLYCIKKFEGEEKEREVFRATYNVKKEFGGPCKLLPDGQRHDVADLNTTHVEDWTLRLFPDEGTNEKRK